MAYIKYVCLIFLVLLYFIILPSSLFASNFIRVPIGKDASIELPKNWVILNESRRLTIDAFVEAKGYKQTESILSFAAQLHDEKGQILAKVNARFYPTNPYTQSDAIKLSSSELKEFDLEASKVIESVVNSMGKTMLNWYGTKNK